MNPAYKEAEAAYQLNDSGAKILITTAEGAAVIREVQKELPTLETIIVTDDAAREHIFFEDWIGAHPTESLPEPQIDFAQDLIALPYSSGTTGLPKGVMLTHRNLVSNYHQCVANHQITDRDSGLLFLPLYHIYGALIMGALILAGATQVLMKRFTVPEGALRLVQEHKLTLFYGVPPALLAIAHHENLGDYDLSSLRYIMSGAAPLPPEVRRVVQERTGVLTFMGYGLTEASPLTHLNPPVEALIREESVGPPVSDQEQKIVDVETGTNGTARGRDGRADNQGPAHHERLLERARGHGRSAAGRLALYGRHRAGGRAGLRLSDGQEKGDDQIQGLRRCARRTRSATCTCIPMSRTRPSSPERTPRRARYPWPSLFPKKASKSTKKP